MRDGAPAQFYGLRDLKSLDFLDWVFTYEKVYATISQNADKIGDKIKAKTYEA